MQCFNNTSMKLISFKVARLPFFIRSFLLEIVTNTDSRMGRLSVPALTDSSRLSPTDGPSVFHTQLCPLTARRRYRRKMLLQSENFCFGCEVRRGIIIIHHRQTNTSSQRFYILRLQNGTLQLSDVPVSGFM